MYSFSERSLSKLNTCDERLQEIMTEVLQIVDITILEGHRGAERQNQLYDEGKSKLLYPQSKHNSMPSRAVDIAMYPIDWSNRERFLFLAGVVKGVAAGLGYEIRSGSDWDGDNDFYDQTFNDLPHFELVD